MLQDIFRLADPFFRLRATNGEKFPISRAANRSDFLIRLKDDILTLIEHSEDERLRPAQEIIERINRHNMYKCAVDLPLDIEAGVDLDGFEELYGKRVYDMTEHEIEAGILLEAKYWSETSGITIDLTAEDFIVEKYCMHHGAKDGNPLERVRFFDGMSEKIFGPIEDLPTAVAPKLSDYKCKNPTSFQKVGLRIYVREESKKGTVNQIFNQWCEGVKNGSNREACITPGEVQHEDEDMDDDADQFEYDDQYQHYGAIPLSQESEDGDDNNDDREQLDMDRSPIPVKRSSR
jgi:hypothetical protein